MTFLSIPIGPHDGPFAGPLMFAACLAFTLAFVILKLLDKVIDPAKHSSQPAMVETRPGQEKPLA